METRPADGSLPAGATIVPNAGRPADAPGIATERAASKKDATAARQLPDLYAKLAEARATLARAKAAGDEHLNVHHVQFNLAGDEATHMPSDKKAWAALLIKDLEGVVSAAEGKISELGFDPAG